MTNKTKLIGLILFIAFVIWLLSLGCAAPHKMPTPARRPTITGHWQYTHDEEMQWVNDSTSKQKP